MFVTEKESESGAAGKENVSNTGVRFEEKREIMPDFDSRSRVSFLEFARFVASSH